MHNRNRVTMLDPGYEVQQKVIRTVCDELGLVAYLFHTSSAMTAHTNRFMRLWGSSRLKSFGLLNLY